MGSSLKLTSTLKIHSESTPHVQARDGLTLRITKSYVVVIRQITFQSLLFKRLLLFAVEFFSTHRNIYTLQHFIFKMHFIHINAFYKYLYFALSLYFF